MRQSWTDERLDGFRGDVSRRFDEVGRRFDTLEDRMERGFEKVDRRFGLMDHELNRVNDRLDSLVKAMIFGVIAMTSAMVAGFAAIATQV